MDNAPASVQTTVQGSMAWWITSLAISVICCAILFVVFAGYLYGFREKLAVMEAKFSMVEQRNAQISMEIDNLHRRSPIQQIQLIPANISQQYLQQNMPSAAPPAEGPQVPGIHPMPGNQPMQPPTTVPTVTPPTATPSTTPPPTTPPTAAPEK